MEVERFKSCHEHAGESTVQTLLNQSFTVKILVIMKVPFFFFGVHLFVSLSLSLSFFFLGVKFVVLS